MAAGKIKYGSWFFSVLGWDGLLPVCIVLAPTVIRFLIPNNRDAIETTGVVLPIAGFFIRLVIGIRHIASNNCSIAVRRFQYCVFCLAIFLLVGIDAALILSQEMPKGALFATRTDCVVWAILIFIYLTSMTIAMYPGCANSQDDTPWTEDAFDAQEM